MPTNMIRQTMFTAGEVDQITWKRTDVNDYLTAAQSLLNIEVGTTGLAKKRKGTSLSAIVTGYAQVNSKMYDFVDNFDNHYIVLSANNYFYIFTSSADQLQVITNTGANVVTNTGAYVVVNSNSISFVQAVPSPYMTGDLNDIDYTQDNDAIIFSHPNYAPGRLYISMYNDGTPTFAFQTLNIFPYPSYDFNTINYNAYTVSLSVSGNVLTFQFTGVGANPGYTNAWIGGQIIGGGASDTQPIGYALITAVSYSASGGGTVTFTAIVQIPFQTSNYATQGSQYSVRQPAWSSALGYPAKVLFYQNRLWFGNTASLSNAIFGSKINSPINFDVGTGQDTDAIVYIIGQNNSGSILWMNGGKQMEIYCENFEFACPQNENEALTPTTFSIRQQSAYGSSPNLKPITYINDSYYSIKTGTALVNFHYNGIGLTYTSSNISIASSHLVKNPTNRALLRGDSTSQDNFIYFLNPSDSSLTTFQFASEYKLAALTPCFFQDNVQLIDVCTINNTVYILKYYSLTQNFTIEQFDDSQRIDAAQTSSMASTGVVTGLDAFDGYTVQVVYQGQDFGQYLVVGGQITVENPTMIADSIMVGLLYDVEITPMYLWAGTQNSPFKKQITRIYVDYFNSLNFYINGNLVPYQNFADIQAGLPLTPQTNTAIVDTFSGWERFGNFNITQSSPFDLQILAIAYQIESAVI